MIACHTADDEIADKPQVIKTDLKSLTSLRKANEFFFSYRAAQFYEDDRCLTLNSTHRIQARVF